MAGRIGKTCAVGMTGRMHSGAALPANVCGASHRTDFQQALQQGVHLLLHWPPHAYNYDVVLSPCAGFTRPHWFNKKNSNIYL